MLQEPVPIASISLFGVTPYTWSGEIQVYPEITTVARTAVVPSVGIPNNAKNLILSVESASQRSTWAAALNGNLSGTNASFDRGANEHLIYSGYGYLGSSQVIIPLSANDNNDTLSFWLRTYQSGVAILEIAIVGWTL
jgi:hypothetical protein